jgi:hypothetical protein
MILTDYTGRLGNQLFTYAFTRCLLEKHEVKEKKVIANFKRSSVGSVEDGFEDSLQYFNVFPYEKESKDLALKYGSIVQRLIYLIYVCCTKIPFIWHNDLLMSYIEKSIEKFGFFFTGAADKARPISLIREKNIFIRGYFADKENFDHIRPILLSEITPKYPCLETNKHLYEAAKRENSVCVSVRRGDYLSEEYKKNFYICDEDYFKNAIKVICEKIDKPTLIFFSNDIEWVKENMTYDAIPCFYESGKDPVWETLRLMYSCHHFIISNSTFSWWAQYLGRKEDKIVISPSRWFANPQWHSNLIDESFIKINI